MFVNTIFVKMNYKILQGNCKNNVFGQLSDREGNALHAVIMWGHSFSNKEHQAGIRKRGPIRPNQFAAHCNVYLDQLILRTVSTQDFTLFGQDKVQKSKSKLHAGGCLSRSIIIYK